MNCEPGGDRISLADIHDATGIALVPYDIDARVCAGAEVKRIQLKPTACL
jgi:hypothetical protein